MGDGGPKRSGSSLRKVVYITGTRADFGLMVSTLQQAAQHPMLDVSVAVTGMHLSPSHGLTVTEVRGSGLPLCGEVPVDMQTRSAVSMSQSVGQMVVGLTELLALVQPDIVLLLGDRGEMLAGAIAALHLGFVSVHIHGGERSGTVDEPVRHAISKLSTYHCVATQEAKARLIRLGEAEERIRVTGAPGLDGLEELSSGSWDEVQRRLELPPGSEFVLALFHPVVQQAGQAEAQTLALIQALVNLDLPVLWLLPNADAGALGVLVALGDGVLPSGSRRVTHLPRVDFCKALKHCTLLVGNSSSGIIEAASFGTPVVNVGDRQRLRERNSNVVDVAAEACAIEAAMRRAISQGRCEPHNVYGDGNAGTRIVSCLAEISLDRAVLEKSNTY